VPNHHARLIVPRLSSARHTVVPAVSRPLGRLVGNVLRRALAGHADSRRAERRVSLFHVPHMSCGSPDRWALTLVPGDGR
jgi:hypothetical protein